MIISLVARVGISVMVLSSPLVAQAKQAASIQLPPEMESQTAVLNEMLTKVEGIAKKLGFEGWPETTWDGNYTPEPPILKSMSPIIRKVWANNQVLWVYVPSQKRWNAVLILTKKSATRVKAPCRLVWLQDAFGRPALSAALQKDSWEKGNNLGWQNGPRHLYGQGFRLIKGNSDLQQLWDIARRGKERRFTCMLPDSDAGLSLAVHPELGVGYQVDAVAEEDDGDSIDIILKPAQFKKAKIARSEAGDVWFYAPVWQNDPQPFLCLSREKGFKNWAKH
jgi:hypothetical protein